MEKAKNERRAAEKATQDTIPAYVPLDDIKSGKNLVYWIGGLLGAATLTSILPKFISYFIPK
jgi:hypothetical protein